MSVRQSHSLLRLALAWTGILIFTTLAFGQIDQGAIRGTIFDASNAAVPEAKITLTNEGTGLVQTTTSSSDGSYSFSPIRIGMYQVDVEKPGFQSLKRIHVEVHTSEQVKADATLQPGSVQQTVEVTSQIPLLQTQSSNVGQDIGTQQVSDLPLNGRNYTYLTQLGAGVTNMQNGRVSGGGGGFTANGLSWAHNSYVLDGIDNNNNTVDTLNGHAFVVLTPPDAVQEVNVQTSDFTAEYGRAGSAVVNVTTKSGTNRFSGDLWEYMRNDALDASTWSANRSGTAKPELRQNQFGFTIGGPVLIPHLYDGHNKTFFFGDYQGTRIAQQSLENPTVPTANVRNSGFTNFQDLIFDQSGTRSDALGRTLPQGAILDPATTRQVLAGKVDSVTGLVAQNTGYIRDPFFQGSIAGITNFATSANEHLMNVLPSNRLDPNAIKLLSAFPAPNTAGFSGGLDNNYAALRPNPDSTNQFDVRGDQIFSEKDQMFVRAAYASRNAYNPSSFTGPIDNSGYGQGNFVDHSLSGALSETHTFSPTIINEARIGISRLTDVAEPDVANTAGIPQQFGINGVPQGPGLGGLPFINISGLTGIGPGEWASPNTRVTDTRQITENLTMIRGSHTFKGGFEVQRIRYSFDDPRDPRGRLDYRGSYTGIPGTGSLGSGMADLLLTPIASTVPGGIDYDGGPGYVIADSNVEPDEVRHYYGAYFQDDWKVTPKLTVNAGLRWEFFGQPNNKYGAQANFVPGAGQNGGEYLIDSSAKSVPLSPAFTSLLAQDGISLRYSSVPGLVNTPLNNFAPRIGLAYQITSRLVARAAYGIFYAGFENLGGAPDLGANYPFAVEPALNDGTNGTFTLPSQNKAIPAGFIPSLENTLTLVTPNATNPAFNPQGMSFSSIDPNWKTGYTQEWNFSLQYALTPNDSIQAAYVGNHSLHQLNGFRVNSPTEILPQNLGINTQNYVPYPDFAQNFSYITPNGDAYYYGFQLTYQRRMAHGLGLLANYTHSRCMSDYRNILNDDSPGYYARAAYLPGFGVKGDYMLCNDDSPNVVHLSGTWEIPYGRGQHFGSSANRVVDAVLGGWSTNFVLTAQNGFPGTVGCPVSTTADFGCVSFMVPGQSIYSQKGPHGIDQFLNPAAFTNPPLATSIGQSDYTPLGGKGQQFHGPSFNNLDFSLFKQFTFTERTHLQLRGEFFNILNHPNFGNNFVTLDFTNSAFGQINNTTGNARQVQVAAKFLF
jgi:Carboxypeptidase regulatory-like domain/TonB dependent receptor